MLLALFFVALIQSQTTLPEPGAPPQSPIDAATLRDDGKSMTVTVYPRAPRTVKSVEALLIATEANLTTSPPPLLPRATRALSENGVEATFTIPEGRFFIRITLDDHSEGYLDDQGRRTNVGPGPYRVRAVRDMTLRRTD